MVPILRARFTGHTGAVYALADGTRPRAFLSAGSDGHVVEWDLDHPDAGKALVRVGQIVYVLRREGPWLYVGTSSGSLHVVDLVARREVQLLQLQQKGIHALVRMPDGGLACAAGDGTLALFSGTEQLRTERHFPLCDAKLRDLALSTDGRLLAVACGDGTVRLLDTVNLNELHTIEAHAGGALCVAFHPTKPALLSAGKDGHLRLWRTDDGMRAMLALPAHKAAIYRIAFAPDGRTFATAGRDKHVKLWDARTFDPLGRIDRTMGGHQHSVNTLHWADNLLVTAGDDRQVLAWEIRTA